MKKAKVLVTGSDGRMGQEILTLLDQDKQLELQCEKLNQAKAKEVDVVIDFSSPEHATEVAAWCSKNKVPLVCGTTGFSETQFKKIQAAAKNTAVLYSSNMSMGVAVLKRAMKSLAAIADYDFQVSEAHHAHKKDKPGGTAKMLQASLEKIVNKKLPEVLVTRGGGIFGVHQVLAMGAEETLEFSHTALNRALFARGALKAAKFLLNKKAGLYSLDDVLDDKAR